MCGAELLAAGLSIRWWTCPYRFDDRTWAHMFHPAMQALIDPFIGVDAFCMPLALSAAPRGMSADDAAAGRLARRRGQPRFEGDHSTISSAR